MIFKNTTFVEIKTDDSSVLQSNDTLRGRKTDTLKNQNNNKSQYIDIKLVIMLLVYVRGLHDVQFGNNWMKKIPRTAKTGRDGRPSPIWQSEEFFESNYFQIGRECSPLTY